MEHDKKLDAEVSGEGCSDLQMAPQQMLDIAQKAAELLVERIVSLPGQDDWDGEFRQGLDHRLMEDPPEEGRPAAGVLERAVREILPVAARLDHPSSFGFISSSPTWPGVLADFMAAGYNGKACTWLVASGPSQLELVVIDWFRRWLGYPEGAGGLFTSGGSSASLSAFVAAREAAGHPERATVYMSDQSHSALRRAAMVIGVRPEGIRVVPSDDRFRLDVESLAQAVAADRAAGFNPIAVAANAGTSSTGAIDPLEAMADYCEAEGIWLHVDAAYGGFAVVAEEGKRLLRGIERADSVGLDAHKWFFQSYEAGSLLVKDASRLERAFSVQHDVFSVRALKIWMSFQTFGMAAFRRAISKGMELAAQAGEYILESLTLELLTPVSLGVVCFRVNPTYANLDEEAVAEVNRKVLVRVFCNDRVSFSSTLLRKTFALRLCIVNPATTWDDVRETLEAAERLGMQVVSERESSQWQKAEAPPARAVDFLRQGYGEARRERQVRASVFRSAHTKSARPTALGRGRLG